MFKEHKRLLALAVSTSIQDDRARDVVIRLKILNRLLPVANPQLRRLLTVQKRSQIDRPKPTPHVDTPTTRRSLSLDAAIPYIFFAFLCAVVVVVRHQSVVRKLSRAKLNLRIAYKTARLWLLFLSWKDLLPRRLRNRAAVRRTQSIDVPEEATVAHGQEHRDSTPTGFSDRRVHEGATEEKGQKKLHSPLAKRSRRRQAKRVEKSDMRRVSSSPAILFAQAYQSEESEDIEDDGPPTVPQVELVDSSASFSDDFTRAETEMSSSGLGVDPDVAAMSSVLQELSQPSHFGFTIGRVSPLLSDAKWAWSDPPRESIQDPWNRSIRADDFVVGSQLQRAAERRSSPRWKGPDPLSPELRSAQATLLGWDFLEELELVEKCASNSPFVGVPRSRSLVDLNKASRQDGQPGVDMS